ncbi:hypothetical protein ZIOFF_033403 [Zingiber officinale]|uniref:Uncharacterized protein n=1 Tax=Zingiber officinale TaxID=94328 RepID=A0A8J5GX02_ZINOF|nr:hypothetical protein ZIOFF_033403 [Zingiber officinale]
MVELMKNSEEMKRVQEVSVAIVGLDRLVQEGDLDKLPYLKCTVKEMLDLHQSIPLLLHETVKETQVAGYLVPMWWVLPEDIVGTLQGGTDSGTNDPLLLVSTARWHGA